MLPGSPGLLGSLTTTPGAGIRDPKEIDQEFSKEYLQKIYILGFERNILYPYTAERRDVFPNASPTRGSVRPFSQH